MEAEIFLDSQQKNKWALRGLGLTTPQQATWKNIHKRFAYWLLASAIALWGVWKLYENRVTLSGLSPQTAGIPYLWQLLYAAIALLLAAILLGHLTPPRPMRLNPARSFHGSPTLWPLSLPALAMMVMVTFWIIPAIGEIGWPQEYFRSERPISESDLAALQWAGGLMLLAGSLPWILVVIGWRSKLFLEARRLWPLASLGVVVLMVRAYWINPANTFGILSAKDDPTANIEQLILYFGGLTLFIVSFMSLDELGRVWRRLRDVWRWEWGLVALLVMVAFALRIYRIETLIPILVSDEPPYLAISVRILNGEVLGIGQERLFRETFLGGFFIAEFLNIFGINLLGGRLLAVILGSVVIVPVYWMARRLFNPPVAVMACLFLATQPVHFHFSRLMMNMVFDPLFAIIAILLMWDAFERGGRWKFAGAGVLIGLAQLFYVGSRLWLVLIPAWWGLMLLTHPQTARKTWSSIPPFIIGVLLAIAPMMANLNLLDYTLLDRQYEMSNVDEGEGLLGMPLGDYWQDKLLPAIRAYIDMGEVTYHYDFESNIPLHLIFAFVVFGLGMVYAIRFSLHPGILLLLMWIVATTILGGSIPSQVPGFSRYLNALLPITILMGAGVYWFTKLITYRLVPRAWPLLATGIVIAVCWQNLAFAFIEHPKGYLETIRSRYWLIERFGGTVLAQETTIASQQVNSQVYWLTFSDMFYVTNLRYYELYQFYSGQGKIEIISLHSPIRETWLAGLDTNKNHYLFVAPQANDPTEPAYQPGPANPIWIILKAYPAAVITHYDSEALTGNPALPLYTRIMIPAGAIYCPPETCPRPLAAIAQSFRVKVGTEIRTYQ